MRKTAKAVLAFALAGLPIAAQASTMTFLINGGGAIGAITLTYEVDTNTGVLPMTSPNPVDPIGAYTITGVSGTISDAGAGITDAAVTGLVPLNNLPPVAPESSNLLAPNSFSLYPVANGVDEGNGIISPGLHYDNLLYPAGSPKAASDYPFSGGAFDIYGMAFTIEGGDVVNLWSNGYQPHVGLNYGVAVTDGTDVLDYVNGVSVSGVPETGTWAMMIGGLGILGAGLRRRAKKAALA